MPLIHDFSEFCGIFESSTPSTFQALSKFLPCFWGGPLWFPKTHLLPRKKQVAAVASLDDSLLLRSWGKFRLLCTTVIFVLGQSVLPYLPGPFGLLRSCFLGEMGSVVDYKRWGTIKKNELNVSCRKRLGWNFLEHLPIELKKHQEIQRGFSEKRGLTVPGFHEEIIDENMTHCHRLCRPQKPITSRNFCFFRGGVGFKNMTAVLKSAWIPFRQVGSMYDKFT